MTLRMSNNRVRLQLQQSTENIASKVAAGITADATLKALRELQAEGKKHHLDAKWSPTLDAAIHKAETWVKSAKSKGGYIGRSSGTAYSVKFLYDRKEYRIDIEIHGERDPGWFS